jgi:hypothetical protein
MSYISWNIIELDDGQASTPEEALSSNGVEFELVGSYDSPKRYVAKLSSDLPNIDLSFWNVVEHTREEIVSLMQDYFIEYSDSGKISPQIVMGAPSYSQLSELI